jgi:hypothetical protein
LTVKKLPHLDDHVDLHTTAPLVVDDDIRNPEWDIIDDSIEDDTYTLHGHEFSEVDAWFVVERRSEYYTNFIIVPGILIVLVSYTSFWIDYRAIPGRVTLCVIPVLTSVTMLSESYSRLPRISYTTWLLTFLYINVTFTVVAMLEFVLLSYCVDMKRQCSGKQ